MSTWRISFSNDEGHIYRDAASILGAMELGIIYLRADGAAASTADATALIVKIERIARL